MGSGLILESKAEPVSGARVEYTLLSREIGSSHLRIEFLEQLYEAGCIDERDRYKVSLAFQEAITNAHEHGNLELKSEWREITAQSGGDLFSATKGERLGDARYSERSVFITMEFTGTEMVLVVRDEGPGFELPAQQSIAEGLTRPHGRGIALIGLLMDSVVYRLGGREVELRKTVRSDSVQEEG